SASHSAVVVRVRVWSVFVCVRAAGGVGRRPVDRGGRCPASGAGRGGLSGLAVARKWSSPHGGFRMKRWTTGLVMTVVSVLLLSSSAFAQGGGASSTGTIQGRVVDEQGAVLPGVTVTATSPALLGQQTAVTSETGNYRFPAVPPGTYTLTFELPGFNTIKREGIQITLGFTATVNVEMGLATLEETVTLTGDSPIIDTTSTRTQQNFKLEQL